MEQKLRTLQLGTHHSGTGSCCWRPQHQQCHWDSCSCRWLTCHHWSRLLHTQMLTVSMVPGFFYDGHINHVT